MRPRKFLTRSLLPIAVFMAVPLAVVAAPLRVVTDIAPVHSLVSQVLAGVNESQLLMDQGADAHHFALRPSHARALQSADLVVWLGPEMTPWLQTALSGVGEKAEVLGLLAADGTKRRAYGGAEDHAGHDHAGHDHGDHDHDHEGHEEHDDHAGHDHGHSHEGTDPHAWLDPTNAIAWLDLIAREVSARDPENAATYRANADAARKELLALDAEIEARLAPHAPKYFVVSHEALGYFTGRYGLDQAGAVADGDAAAPGAARLRALRAELAEKKAVCAFPEVGRDAGVMALIVEGTSTRLGAPLDPEGREIELGAALYPTLLRNLTQNLDECLSGAK